MTDQDQGVNHENGAVGEPICDTYVYRRSFTNDWFWNCPCGAKGGPFRRRSLADVSAEDHQRARR